MEQYNPKTTTSGGHELIHLMEIAIKGHEKNNNPNDTAANRTLNSKGLLWCTMLAIGMHAKTKNSDLGWNHFGV